MRFLMVGVNHRTAPVAVLERLSIGSTGLTEALAALAGYVPYGVILSTCNRSEIYAIAEDGQDERDLLDFLGRKTDVATEVRPEYIKVLHDGQAMMHLFRVACGLESLAIGECEILGQVKTALESAEAVGMVNLPLRYVFQKTVGAGRRVRHETDISKNAVSVSSVAVDIAAGLTPDLKSCRLLIIGTGQASRLVAQVALKRGVSRVAVVSRSRDRARSMAAALPVIPADLGQLQEEMSAADVVITCTGAPHRILDKTTVAAAMAERAGRPLVIIDIALPRNVDPEVGQIGNVVLYNMEDLEAVASSNHQQRKAEAKRAEAIIEAELEKLGRWWRDLQTRPLIGALMSRAEEIRLAQLNKTLKKLPPLSAEQRESLESMTKSIVNRMLEEPIQYLKSNGNGGAETIRELFKVDAECLR